jgi:hypothetical protein
MKNLFTLIWIATFISGCNTTSNDINRIITNPILQDCLKQIISHEDSLQKNIPTYGIIKSFTITFSQENQKCFVEFVADFDNYDSHAMDGYFIYDGKYISFYGASSICGDNFINKKKLKHGLIPGLYDFNNKAFELAIKEGLPGPPPPPPGEPYYRKYLISSPEVFVKVKDYDDDVKSFQQGRYQK